MKQLLLISNSTLHGSGYLDHCADEIKRFLEEKNKVLFIPYARPGGISHEEYTSTAKKRFKKMGFELTSITEINDAKNAIDSTDAIFIGGGNTFVLISMLYKNNLIEPIRKVVSNGTLYIGTSAGSNVACRSVKTTNDMPIYYPSSFDGLNLVPFNINPHYIDPDPGSKHMGETRDTRIKEFHVYNDTPVIGLREGAMIHCVDDSFVLKGDFGAKLFTKDADPKELKIGKEIKDL
ncbi:MAG: dipeptidase PepE [Thermoplasmatota archaeon]